MLVPIGWLQLDMEGLELFEVVLLLLLGPPPITVITVIIPTLASIVPVTPAIILAIRGGIGWGASHDNKGWMSHKNPISLVEYFMTLFM